MKSRTTTLVAFFGYALLYTGMLWMYLTSCTDNVTRVLLLAEPVIMTAVLIGIHKLTSGHALFPWMMSYFFLSFGMLLLVNVYS